MRPGPASPFRSKSRDAALSADEARRAWRLLLDEAARVAREAAQGRRPDKFAGDLFAGQVIRMKAPFPAPHVSAQSAAEAFLVLARNFVAGGFTPANAAFLAEGARCLAEHLDADTRAAFARSCRAAGGED